MHLGASEAKLAARESKMPTSSRVALTELPKDVFLFILENLNAWDVVRCRKVSREWREVFSKNEYLRVTLKKYPLAREVQELSHKDSPDRTIDWQGIFDKIASRYYHLTHGKARSITTYKLAALEQFHHWYPVSQWDYHESQPGGRLYHENTTHISRPGVKPYLFRPTFWSYEDGLIVFAPSATTEEGSHSPATEDQASSPLVVLDIETEKSFPVPFDITGKILRNLRLKDRTLVIEWAEKDPFHDLNDSEKVHRHFATCFDVQPLADWSGMPSDPTPNPNAYSTSWVITLRSEWKMHFLGLPLNQHDRFFSTHTSIHYAVYFWQPNRSMYTGDEEHPIESLFVWDISSPSTYLPSTDPAGKHRPRDAHCGPKVLSRFSFHALDFLGIRQQSNITLMLLVLDSPSNTITIRTNVCVAGQGYFDPAERLWCAKTTSFPFLGFGPHLVREWDGNLPPYRGHCSMESAEVEESEKWFLPVMDVVDVDVARNERVRFSLVETCFNWIHD
jgi:F-box domain